jgi:aspartokinase
VSGVERIDNCCVLAAVGQGMVRRKGVAATMMGALAKANVNIKALAQVRTGVEKKKKICSCKHCRSAG